MSDDRIDYKSRIIDEKLFVPAQPAVPLTMSDREQSIGFDYDAVDAALMTPALLDAQQRAEIVRQEAERIAAHGLRELLRWLIVGSATDGELAAMSEKSLTYWKRRRYCVQRIGRRAISAAWVIDPSIVQGMSLRQLADIPDARSNVNSLSHYAVEFKDKFGVRSRGMKSERARANSSAAASKAWKQPRADRKPKNKKKVVSLHGRN